MGEIWGFREGKYGVLGRQAKKRLSVGGIWWFPGGKIWGFQRGKSGIPEARSAQKRPSAVEGLRVHGARDVRKRPCAVGAGDLGFPVCTTCRSAQVLWRVGGNLGSQGAGRAKAACIARGRADDAGKRPASPENEDTELPSSPEARDCEASLFVRGPQLRSFPLRRRQRSASPRTHVNWF